MEPGREPWVQGLVPPAFQLCALGKSGGLLELVSSCIDFQTTSKLSSEDKSFAPRMTRCCGSKTTTTNKQTTLYYSKKSLKI